MHMDRDCWEEVWDRLIDEGWQLVREKRFRPLFGRYWEVEARHESSGRLLNVEAPTMKIAMKKLVSLLKKS